MHCIAVISPSSRQTTPVPYCQANHRRGSTIPTMR
jgi:hypothetical protein